jgi:hypothetical protein
MAQIQQSGRRYPNQGGNYPNQGGNYPTGDPTGYPAPTGRVDLPSSRYRSYNEGSFTVSVPENWRQINEQGSLWFAPNGAYGSGGNGQPVFTHAVSFGVTQSSYGNLQQATNDFVNSLQQGNGNMRSSSGYQRVDVGGRAGLFLTLNNVNEATGRPEVVSIITTQLRNGELFYMIAVSPRDDYTTYQSTFANIMRSLQFND